MTVPTVLVWLVSGLVTVLLGIVAYFLGRHFKRMAELEAQNQQIEIQLAEFRVHAQYSGEKLQAIEARLNTLLGLFTGSHHVPRGQFVAPSDQGGGPSG